MRIVDKNILKTFADAIFCGEKTFEIRENDEAYQKGDVIRFKVMENEHFFEDRNHPLNGQKYEITYVLSGWGLQNGYVALGIKPYKETGNEADS